MIQTVPYYGVNPCAGADVLPRRATPYQANNGELLREALAARKALAN